MKAMSKELKRSLRWYKAEVLHLLERRAEEAQTRRMSDALWDKVRSTRAKKLRDFRDGYIADRAREIARAPLFELYGACRQRIVRLACGGGHPGIDEGLYFRLYLDDGGQAIGDLRRLRVTCDALVAGEVA